MRGIDCMIPFGPRWLPSAKKTTNAGKSVGKSVGRNPCPRHCFVIPPEIRKVFFSVFFGDPKDPS